MKNTDNKIFNKHNLKTKEVALMAISFVFKRKIELIIFHVGNEKMYEKDNNRTFYSPV